jgi:uncharacterized protein involved in exopolysaccharide biosynthesis
MLIMGVGTFVVTTLLPKWYRSEASLFFPASANAAPGGVLGSLSNLARGGSAIPEPGGQMSFYGNALSSPLVASGPQTAIAVLSSLNCRKRVAEQLDLAKRWDIPRDQPWKVWSKLETSVTFGVDKNGLLAVEAADEDSVLARDINNAYISTLQEMSKVLSLNLATRNRKFLEQRLSESNAERGRLQRAYLREVNSDPDPVTVSGTSEAAKAAVTLEQELVKANVALGAVTSQLQWQSDATRSAVKAGHNMPAHTIFAREQRARVARLEYEFAVAKDTFGPDNARYRMLEGELSAAREQLKREIAKESRALESGIAPEVIELRAQQASLQAEVDGLTRALDRTKGRLAGVPGRQMRRETIQQELKVLGSVIEYQTMEYQRARVAEERDPTTFVVMDAPEIPPLPFAPRRLFSSVLAAFAGLLLGVAFLVGRSVAQQAGRAIPEPATQAVIRD